MRLVIVLAVAAAVTVMVGAIVMVASVVMRFLTRHQSAHLTRLGLDLVAAGHGDGRPVRRPALNPTNVYSPGGLIDVPRDGRYAGPPRDSRFLRDPGPPRDLGYLPPPGSAPSQYGGAGRHARSPGHATPGGHWSGPAHAGPSRPAQAPESFDGGYAKVIRASDYPVRPAPARPPRPGYAGPASPGPDENDPAYWYDLTGASGPGGTEGSQGSGNSDRSKGSGDGTSHVLNRIRGPFEPLLPGTPAASDTPLADQPHSW